MFFKIGVLKNFKNFTEKQLGWRFFLIKFQALRSVTSLKTDSNTGVFLWKLQTFSVHLFLKTRPVAASENNEQQQLSEGFANSCYKIDLLFLLQELINSSVVCKHSTEALLLVEDVTASLALKNRAAYFNKEPYFLID